MHKKATSSILILLICAVSMGTLMAQEDGTQPLPEVPKGSVADKIKDRSFDDTQVLLKQEFTGGAMLHTQGS
jgi:hypothetical protein